MVASSFLANVRTMVGTFAAAIWFLGAGPAFANSSASADIAAPLRAAQASRPAASTDEQFRQLFSNWRSLDKTGASGLVAVRQAAIPAAAGASRMFARPGSASIPSRMPVEGVRLSSDFGMRTHPVLGGRRGHKGVDLSGPVGTPIYATADGVVSKAEWFSSYGLYVSLEHGADIQTRYAHMSRINVASGQQVRKGDVIGFVGSTGRSTGPHLHYEVRIAGKAVNPIPYMQADQFRTAAVAINDASAGKGGPE